jgi:acyl transferase domain-containing protein/acyl carrier protein
MSDFLTRVSQLPPKKLALLANELNSRLEKAEGRASEPIAVVGMGCRFPGGADSPDAFWRLLAEGRDATSELPKDRFDIDSLYDPDPDAPGRISTKRGGFLRDLDRFDPTFFGISKREADTMDPQQRLLLETAWEAIESAGWNAANLVETKTGVFAGLCNGDYYQRLSVGSLEEIDAYLATGSAHSVASGRISYLLGLRGPSVSVDTACSSSLVAIHFACLSLRSGECRAALAGGVNVILLPELWVTLSKARMLAPDGRCKAFDDRADGFARGEGCGMVLLKRLSDAVADGDRIQAVIRGTALNQDGRSGGLTAPNGPSQEAVILEALKNAKMNPEDVGYIETHGTGTALGDPIEARALGSVFRGRGASKPLRIGSVKSNIGHLESAAGIAGFIKAVLILSRGKIPPLLHLSKKNSRVDWDRMPLEIPVKLTDWAAGSGRRVVGVSSFGFSGTNAHIILEGTESIASPETGQSENEAGAERTVHALSLSARNEAALREMAARHSEWIEANPAANAADYAFTTNAGRQSFEHRLAFVFSSMSEAAELLKATGEEEPEGVARGRVKGSRVPEIAFLFTGQGSQCAGMGRGLFETAPLFRKTMLECDEILRPALERPLISVIYPEPGADSPINETAYAQPALFALEYALARLWMSWGIRPSTVAGHSVGEYVAACVAGVFSLEDGLKLVAERARLMQSLPPGGGMASVFAGADRVKALIAPYGNRLSIAAINGPENTVISGDQDCLDQALSSLASMKVNHRPLRVSHAFHSARVEPILDDFFQAAKKARFQEPKISLISNLTGQFADGRLVARPEYWRDHVRQAVLFADGLRAMDKAGVAGFLEVGPHPVLTAMGQACLGAEAGRWFHSLKRDGYDWREMLANLGALWTRGAPVDWRELDRDHSRARLDLPTYPFQRERCWAEVKPRHVAVGGARESTNTSKHPLIGRRMRSPWLEGAVYETELGSGSRPAFLEDHRVLGRMVMPSPAYIEMAFEAHGREQRIDGAEGDWIIRNLEVQEGLLLPEDGSKTIQILLERDKDAKDAAFRVCGLTERSGEETWRTHAQGRVAWEAESQGGFEPGAPSLAELKGRSTAVEDSSGLYERLRSVGLEFGERFQGIRRIHRLGAGEALGEIELPEALQREAGPYRIHPALLDSCFHLLGAALPEDLPANAYLLIAIDSLRLRGRAPKRFWNYTRLLRPHSSDGGTTSNWETFGGDVFLMDEEGRVFGEVRGMSLKLARRETLLQLMDRDESDWAYEIAWEEQALEQSGKREKEIRKAGPAALPSIESVVDGLEPRLLEIEKREEFDVYEKLIPELDRLCARFVLKAARDMDWRPLERERFTLEELSALHGVEEKHRRALGRLLEILREEGILAREHDVWMVLRDLEKAAEEYEKVDADDLIRRFPGCRAEIELTRRCGERLAEALRGEADPLHLLFPDGDFTLADEMYRRSPIARAYNSLLREALEGMRSGAGKLRILEIGAGTGGTSSYVLPSLSRTEAEYAYTDVSHLFLAKARDEFVRHDFVEYQILDIEKNPLDQGFREADFDIVIAANVLHATEDLGLCLDHALSLIKPGGALLLLEGVTPQRWIDLSFGLTDGWWRFTDRALRPDYPLLGRDKWETLFAERGFKAKSIILNGDAPAPAMWQQALFLAQKPLPEAKSGRLTNNHTRKDLWLVFSDRGDTGTRLSAQLRRAGFECVEVHPDAAYQAPRNDSARLRHDHAEDYSRLLGDVARDGASSLAGIVYLWAMDYVDSETARPDEVSENLEFINGGPLHILRAIETADLDKTPRIYMATRGARRVVDSEVPRAAQAALWGLGSVMSLEHPEMFGGMVDFGADDESSVRAENLLSEIQAGHLEDQVAWRGNRRLVARVVRAAAPRLPRRMELKPDASYLIVGGLGRVGLATAKWMAERGARNIFLLSRRSFPEPDTWASIQKGATFHDEARALIEIEKSGARARVLQGDVGNPECMRSLFAGFGSDRPPLRGVVHAALDMRGLRLRDMGVDALRGMFHAKARGAWILHELTRDLELDFMVFYSSTTALWGTQSLGHYAAASQYLDALAWRRRPLGLPALSVNWGTWESLGVASADEAKEFRQAGLLPMPARMALDALERLLLSDRTQMAVARIDWSALRGVYEARRPRPLFDKMRDEARPSNPPAPKTKEKRGDSIRSRLETANPKARAGMVVDHLRREVSRILRLGGPEAVETEKGLFDMGMDSLMSVELKGCLEKSYGLSLPATLAFNYPTVDDLSKYLLEELGMDKQEAPLDKTPPPEPRDANPSAGADDDMGEDDLEELLRKRLSELE